MKKAICVCISATLLLGSCAKQEAQEEILTEKAVGGWQVYEDETIVVLPDEIKEAFHQAKENYVGMELTPIVYLGSQVVAGMNYKLLCKGNMITQNPTTKLVSVTVYKDLDGNCSILDVKDFDLNILKDESNEEKIGGWQVNEEYVVINLPVEAQRALDESIQDLKGVNYEPLALLATQVTSNVHYAILCHSTVLSKESTSGLAVLVVSDEGLVSICQLNLSSL